MKKCAYLCILLCHCHPSRNEVSAAELPILHLLSYLLTLVETEPDMPSYSTLIIAVSIPTVIAMDNNFNFSDAGISGKG